MNLFTTHARRVFNYLGFGTVVSEIESLDASVPDAGVGVLTLRGDDRL